MIWIFQFAFGCHHDQLSRVFTIKQRTYKVCMECGEEFDYSWARMHIQRPAVADPVYVPLNTARHPKFW
jgi:hypothetical protein